MWAAEEYNSASTYGERDEIGVGVRQAGHSTKARHCAVDKKKKKRETFIR